MTIQQAIKKAVDGGYENPIVDNWLIDAESGDVLENQDNDLVANLFLDTLFWQSLGKAMGWSEGSELIREKFHVPRVGAVGRMVRYPEWKWQWIHFIEHLAEGGTPESFFKDL